MPAAAPSARRPARCRVRATRRAQIAASAIASRMARIQPAALPLPSSLDVAAVFGDGWVWGFGMGVVLVLAVSGVVWVLAVSGLACFLRSVVRDPSDRCDPRSI